MKRYWSRLSFSLMFLCAHSQSLFENAGLDIGGGSNKTTEVDFSGYGRGSVFGGGKQYKLASSFAEMSLQTRLKSREALLNGDIRLRKGIMFEEDVQLIEVKELYAGYSSNSFDCLIGNQLVNWGRTDGFNPTNNITPNDYFFLSADPDDQKMSNFMLRLKYRFSSKVDIDIVGVPYFKPSVYRFDLFDMNQEMDLGSDWVTIASPVQANVVFDPLELPKRKLSNGSLGARLNFELQKIGFAVSYFSGYDHFHGFDLKDFKINILKDPTDIFGNPTGIFLDSTQILINYQPRVYKKKTIGFDMALPLPGFLLKAEAAYNIVRNKDSLMYIPNSDLSYVIGVEKMWNDYVFIAQYIGKTVSDFKPVEKPELGQLTVPSTTYVNDMVIYASTMFNRLIFNQPTEFNHAFAFTVTKSFAHDEWNAEFTAYYNLFLEEYMLRPKLTWKVNDYLTVIAGANYMHAKNLTLFHFSSKIMNGVFVELKVNF
jgi:hypothetical protein